MSDNQYVFKWSDANENDLIYVSGSWDHWQTQTYLFNGSGHAPIALQPGITYLYKFIVNGEWKVDPNAPTVTQDFTNNVVTIPENDLKDATDRLRYVDNATRGRKGLKKRTRKVIRGILRIKKPLKQSPDLFPNGVKCIICLHRYPLHRTFASNCGHGMCYDCLEQYILRQCDALSLPLTCPDCTGVIDPRPLKEIAAPIRDLYHQKLGYLQQKDLLQRCANEQCGITYIRQTSDLASKCPVCAHLSCTKCGQTHNVSVGCDVHMDELFEEYTKHLASYRHCECGRHITRLYGCNKVHCTCGREHTLPYGNMNQVQM